MPQEPPMRRAILVSFAGFVLLCGVGCGESSKLLMRDRITFENEVLDALSKIPDDDNAEEAANYFVQEMAPMFKKRFEKIQKRYEIYYANPDAEIRRDHQLAADYWKSQGDALMARGKYEL